jgi:hypothetical protein
MSKRLVSRGATTGHGPVAEQDVTSPQKLSESSAAKRARWLIWLTVCALFALSWCVFLAFILLMIAAIQWLHRALSTS